MSGNEKPPVKKEPNDSGTGAPQVTEDQYLQWLIEMTPFLQQGCSLNYAINKCNLMTHQSLIYKKYAQKDWFMEKIDTLRATIGELANQIGYKVLINMKTKMLETEDKYIPTREEATIWKTIAEKHRTAQPFFVNRTEEAKAGEKDEDFGKVVDTPTITYVVPEQAEEPAPEEDQNAEDGDNTQTDAPTASGVEETNGQDNA